MPERSTDDRSIKPETIAGLLAGVAPSLQLLSQRGHADLSKVRAMSAARLNAAARPGDLLLTQGRPSWNAFSHGAPAVSGTPYYHSELIFRDPSKRSLRTAVPGLGASQGIKEVLLEARRAVLVRPQNLPENSDAKIRSYAKKMYKGPYADVKIPVMGAARTLLPDFKGLSKIPPVCKGNVCTTGGADLLRKLKVDPGLSAPQGLETGGDYLRSRNWKPIATFGEAAPKNPRMHALPGRLALGGALGLGVHRLVKDTREGDYTSPAAAIAGSALGGLAGKKLDDLAWEAAIDEPQMRERIRARVQGIAGKTKIPKSFSRVPAHILQTLHNKYTAIPSVLGLLGGGAAAYAASKYLRKKNEN